MAAQHSIVTQPQSRYAEPMLDDPSHNIPVPGVPPLTHTILLRVRYSDTDQMGTVYNSRPLEWFECGRTEMLRSISLPYADLEAKGIFLPLIEAHLEYTGRARYDDLISITTTLTLEGRARLRCSVEAVHAASKKGVVRGYTIHVFTNSQGKPLRPPEWIVARIDPARREAGST